MKMGRPAVEVIMTVLHAGGKFDGSGYKVSGGLHGVGASVVNALSTELDVTVYRDGKIHYQEFERGVPKADLKVIGDTEVTGTTTHFKPDPEIFTETTEYDYDTLATRVRELAFLTKGVKITIEDKREGKERKNEYCYEGGIKSYVEHLNRSREVIHEEPVYIEGSKDGITVEVALQYNDSYTSNIYSFANNIHTYEGGTHEAGFKTGLTRVINDYARRNGVFKAIRT